MTIHTLRVTTMTALAVATLTAADPPAALQKEIAAIAASGGGRVGAAAMLVETGERVAVRGGERFPMQSVFKLPVGLWVLHEVDAGRVKLDTQVTLRREDLLDGGLDPIATAFPDGGTFSIEDLLRRMVANSDNTAVEAILKRSGGPPAVTRWLRSLGVTGIRVDRGERQMGRDLTGPGALERYERDPRDTATPDGAVDLLAKVLAGANLEDASQDRLRSWMTDTRTGPMRIKGLLPSGTPVAHKTGTGPDRGGVNAATNDIGLILLPGGRHLAVAVFIAESRQPLEAREAVIAKISKAAYEHWSK